jgi:Zn-dependent protease
MITEEKETGKKRVYRSFRDIPPREYMYFPKGTLEMGKPGRFSRTEIIHIIIALIVLTIAFSFPLSQSRIINGSIAPQRLIDSIPVAFLALLTAFFIHELAHKFMAQRYGLWSEFRMFPLGLMLSLLLAIFTGVVFAAPGAVIFRGGETRLFETGRIAAAGSTANIIIAAVSLLLYFHLFFDDITIGTLIGFICLVNGLLATFNLIPLGSLDGKKIIVWNGIVWGILFSSAIVIVSIILPRLPYFFINY